MNEVSKRRLLEEKSSTQWPSEPIVFSDVQYIDCRIEPDIQYLFSFGYAKAYDDGNWTQGNLRTMNYTYQIGMNDIISRSYDQRTVTTCKSDNLAGVDPNDRSFQLYIDGIPNLLSYKLFSVEELEYIDLYTFKGLLTRSSSNLTFQYFTYAGRHDLPLYYNNLHICNWDDIELNKNYYVYILYLPLSKILRIWVPALEDTVSNPLNPYNDESRIIEDKNLDNE